MLLTFIALVLLTSVAAAENGRCYLKDLEYAENIAPVTPDITLPGSRLKVTCDEGYTTRPVIPLCLNGKWERNPISPCKEKTCNKPPPTVINAEEEVIFRTVVKYRCKEPYVLEGPSQIECVFGEWKGPLPKCTDNRCDIKDLAHSSHISLEETPLYVYSGQDLHVTCKKGYSPRLVTPRCLDGQWKRNSKSPCREDDCLVPKIEHGNIIDKVYGERYWDWWKVRYVQEVKRETVPFGTLSSPGTIYHLHCDSGYSFQGSADTERRITCTKANWHPYPFCIPRGSVWKSVNSGILSAYSETTGKVWKCLESGISNLFKKIY